MQLSDERIKLSPAGEADLPLFLDMLTCPIIMKHVSTPCTDAEAKAAFETRSKPWDSKSNGWLTLPITELESAEKVGWISLRILDHQANIAEVGFTLKISAQGKGLASCAFKLLKEYAFNELQLNKLVAFCSVHNTASYGLLEKMGFVREGCFKQHTLINDELIDDYAYGLCKADG